MNAHNIVITGGASGIGLATAIRLASQDSSAVTGTALAVDGGMHDLRLRP
jgi:short-subunit dehydrogenase involved in D-alanine esterification of teichoic acids